MKDVGGFVAVVVAGVAMAYFFGHELVLIIVRFFSVVFGGVL